MRLALLLLLCVTTVLCYTPEERFLQTKGFSPVRDSGSATRTYINGHEQIFVRTPAEETIPFTSGPVGDTIHILPTWVGGLKPGIPITWQGVCFQNNSAVLQASETGFTITLNVTKAKSKLCYDMYLLVDQHNWHITYFALSGTHTISYKWTEEEKTDALVNGIQMFMIEDGIWATIHNIWDLLNMFTSFFGKERSIKHNLAFLEKHMNLTYESREVAYVDIPESEIHDGDYFAMLALNGNDPFIMYGTGSLIGHTAFALWMDGELNVCESTGAANKPDNRTGVICTLYRDWISNGLKDWCQPEGCSVAWLPLSDKARAMFNSTAARQFVDSVLDGPYGWQTLLFGWIDTLQENYPEPLSPMLFASVFQLMEHLRPDLAKLFFLDSLNQRLQTYYGHEPCPDLNCILNAVTTDGFAALMATPELDTWRYDGKRSMVCASFVVQLYREAGLLGPDHPLINGNEFTPRDSYMLNVFNVTHRHPACDVDSLPYCQILGKKLVQLPFVNTVDPYAQMNEKCGAMPLEYLRLPDMC